ncbi:hypothetical protein HAX54_039517 [Datura stramonium]|uniref:Uncharacterized protein n=1 Tax=Datura stramonium TaxID=4076 RepID=A0ABS8SJD4_DATST|nr:hypothetical protein [Datura stramonium]
MLVDWMQGEEDQGMIGSKPVECRCESVRRRSTTGYEQNKGRAEKRPMNYQQNADINPQTTGEAPTPTSAPGCLEHVR